MKNTLLYFFKAIAFGYGQGMQKTFVLVGNGIPNFN